MQVQRGDIMWVSKHFSVSRQYVRLLIEGERKPKRGKGPAIIEAITKLGESRNTIIQESKANIRKSTKRNVNP